MSRPIINRVHRIEVESVEQLTPGMVRIVFIGDGLGGFVSSGVGDEYLRLFLPASGHEEPTLPVPTDDGYWEFPPGTTTEVRTYTVRRWDGVFGRLVIDFVVHEGGIAATWALGAKPGHVVGVNTPRGLYDPPADIVWQLLVADATGVPAALRLAEQAPTGVRTRVVLEIADAADEQHIDVPAGVELTWVHGGNGHGPSRIEDIVTASEFPLERGYVWVAGEARVTRGVRKHLRHVLKLPSTDYKVVGYWTANAEQWTERFEALPDDVRQRLHEMWDDESRAAEEVEDEYEATLESYGL